MSLEKFKLNGKICVITGGAGFLGRHHAEVVIEAGATPILLDIDVEKLDSAVNFLKDKYKRDAVGFKIDITDRKDLEGIKEKILKDYGKINILINNAASNPKVESGRADLIRFENFPENIWDNDLAVGLKGAFLCSQVFGGWMAENGGGVILNISSDLGIIAPDQRIYSKQGLQDKEQPVKPVTYSVVKHGLIGLTKYLATYWASKNVRVNAICPGGIYNGQNDEFIKKLTNLIPLGRMAREDEYEAAVLFLISDASSYMTGSVLVVDGGRTCW